MNNNIYRINSKVSYEDRCKILGQKGIVLWLTGLSGSGKSTLALELEKKLIDFNKTAYLLDGDNIRSGLNSDLGFSENDRNENIRRIIEVAILFKEAGVITLVSFISPFKQIRMIAKEKIGQNFFYEIFIKADINTCIKRDPKGLYKEAINMKLTDFTGITSIYEESENPDLIIDTDKLSIAESAEKLLKFTLGKITL